MNQLSLELPWPPTINQYWRNFNGKVLLSKKGRAYRKDAGWLIRQAQLEQGSRTMKGDVKVVIQALPPDQRKRDLDNILKSLLDCLQHAGVLEDDSQVSNLTVIRAPILGGVVRVVVTDLSVDSTESEVR
jgi:crossover junction endodeoxyribonuclease RusA